MGGQRGGKSLDISRASVHDIRYLKNIKVQLSDCLLIGDRGCLSAEIQLNLFEEQNIGLQAPVRKNQYHYKRQPYFFRKSGKRIET